MKLKIILAILIFISLTYAVILPSSWNMCLPDGCTFASVNECNALSCFNEGVNTHFGERTVFFEILRNNINYLFLLTAAVFLFALYKILNKNFNISQLIKFKLFKHRNTHLNNLFTILFSKGILHPKNF